MPRNGPAAKRQLVTDPVYGSPLVTALANKVLKELARGNSAAWPWNHKQLDIVV